MRFFSRSLRALPVAHSDAVTIVDTRFAQRFRYEDEVMSTRGVEVASGTANELCLGGVLNVPAKWSSLLLPCANIRRSSTRTCESEMFENLDTYKDVEVAHLHTCIALVQGIE